MKILLSDVLNAYGALNELKEKEIDVGMAFKIAKASNELETHLKTFEEVMGKIIEEEKDEEKTNNLSDEKKLSGSFVVKDRARYEKKVNDLKSQFVDVRIDFFTIDELTKYFGKLTPNVLCDLMAIIKD